MKTKKILSILGSASVLAALNAMPASAASSVTLGSTEFNAVEGQEFTTTLFVNGDDEICDLHTTLKYDPDLLKLVSAEPVKATSEDILVNDKEDGKISLSVSFADNVKGKKDLVKLTFAVKDDLGSGTYKALSLDDSSRSTASFYQGEGTFGDVTVTADFPEMSIYPFGDVDLNTKVEVRDVTLLKKHLVDSKTKLDEKQLQMANANPDFLEDGVTPKINTRDAFQILKKTVDMDVALGGRAYVTFIDSEGEEISQRSIPSGSALTDVPSVPFVPGLTNGCWSLDEEEYEAPDFSKITYDTKLYAVYEKDTYYEVYEAVKRDIEKAMSGDTPIEDGFDLPYINKFGAHNVHSSEKFKNVDVTWRATSKELGTSINIGSDFTVGIKKVPEYTTWATFTATIDVDNSGEVDMVFKKPIKGIIDVVDGKDFESLIKRIPENLPEHYRLPGYISLESSRDANKDITNVQNIDIRWTVIRNEDGSLGDERAIDPSTNEICYLKSENKVTIKAEFLFNENVVYETRFERTIPAQPLEKQLEYAYNYISSFVPSVVSGETYLPKTVPLYDFRINWISETTAGKIIVGKEEKNVKGTDYQVITVGDNATFMEWGKITAKLDRAGDDSTTLTPFSYDVQLAGNSTVISNTQIPDTVMYKEFLRIFDQDHGNKDGVLTEEELFDADTMAALNYTIRLNNKGIKSIKGIKYLRYYRVIDLSNNDLSGSNSGIDELSSLNYVEQLSLSNCRLTDVPDSVFASKFLIEGIDLSYNKLKNVDFLVLRDTVAGTEQPYTEMKELFLQGNYITNIDSFLMKDSSGAEVSRFPALRALTLSRDTNYYEISENKDINLKTEYNIHATMDIRPIGYMKQLTTLWLGSNYITDITPLANCKLLNTLDLSNNLLASPSSSKDGLAPLRKLDALSRLLLDNNRLETTTSLKNLTDLEVLTLSNNNIRDAGTTLTALKNLTYLDLDNNCLRNYDVSNHPNLINLMLENQNFGGQQTLEYVTKISSAPHLQELRLAGNSLSEDTVNDISLLYDLKYLSLSGTKVTDLSFLEGLTNLTHLEMADCQIPRYVDCYSEDFVSGDTSVQKTENISYIANHPQLTILDLSRNSDLINIEPLSNLTELRAFYINYVEVADTSAIERMSKLRYLSMQDSLTSNTNFLSKLADLRYVNLSGNTERFFDFNDILSSNLDSLFMDTYAIAYFPKMDVEPVFNSSDSIKYLSLANFRFNMSSQLPDMPDLRYLCVRNTGSENYFWEMENATNLSRYTKLRYVDLSQNEDFFDINDLNGLYRFVKNKSTPTSVILYPEEEQPKGYVPGVLNADIESRFMLNFIDFGEGENDITEAMKAGYNLQDNIKGFPVTWNIEDNDYYEIKDGKLYLKATDEADVSSDIKLSLTLSGLYDDIDDDDIVPENTVDFKASLKATTKIIDSDEMQYAGRETKQLPAPMDKDTMKSGKWELISSNPEEGHTSWSEWSEWIEVPENQDEMPVADDLTEVETRTEDFGGEWSEWSEWTYEPIEEAKDLEIEIQQEAREEDDIVYFAKCSEQDWKNRGINDALYHINEDGSYANRKKIAPLNGIDNYSGTPEQNMKMVDLLYEGKLIKEIRKKTVYYDKYRSRVHLATPVDLYRVRTRNIIPVSYTYIRDVYEPVKKEVTDKITLVVAD